MVSTAGGVTVTDAEPEWLPLVAVINAVPGATPVTALLAALIDATVATAGLEVDHVIDRDVIGDPAESRSVACMERTEPTVRLAVAGVTVTEATCPSSTEASLCVLHAAERTSTAPNMASRVVPRTRITSPPD
jgi:hypothetical protein